MNDQLKTETKKETRYFVALTLESVENNQRHEIILTRDSFEKQMTRFMDMDMDEILQILEPAGYNQHHPNFREIILYVRNSFTLDEISQFLLCLNDYDSIKLRIVPAIYIFHDPVDVYISVANAHSNRDERDFSLFENYSLPFKVYGRCIKRGNIYPTPPVDDCPF